MFAQIHKHIFLNVCSLLVPPGSSVFENSFKENLKNIKNFDSTPPRPHHSGSLLIIELSLNLPFFISVNMRINGGLKTEEYV